MASASTIPISCPDCGRRYDVPVMVAPIDGRVTILTDAFTDSFTEHVMADPESHPSFVTREDDSQLPKIVPPSRHRMVDDLADAEREQPMPRIVGDAPGPGGWIPTGTNGEGYWCR